MTSYQADPETVATQSLSSNEMINELIEETTGINHVEVIQTVIASLEQDESAMVSQTEASYVWKFVRQCRSVCATQGWQMRTPLLFGLRC